MATRLRFIEIVLLSGALGCSASQQQAHHPADPVASNVLQSHWKALQRRDWPTAYKLIHPEIKTFGLTLKQFTALHARRPRGPGLPDDIKITGVEQSGDTVIATFDVLVPSLEGGPPVPLPPRRRVILRRTGDTWGLATTDLLVAGR
jgi:hypothetical protein